MAMVRVTVLAVTEVTVRAVQVAMEVMGRVVPMTILLVVLDLSEVSLVATVQMVAMATEVLMRLIRTHITLPHQTTLTLVIFRKRSMYLVQLKTVQHTGTS